jgi:hypothetical protein
MAMARWNTRFFSWSGKKLHFVPLYPDSNHYRPGEMVPAGVDRPTLCGTYIDGPGGGTTQDNIVSCWPCAVAIESDPQRWVFKSQQNLRTEDGMTWCSTCGDVLQLGEYNKPYSLCHCNNTKFNKIRAIMAKAVGR